MSSSTSGGELDAFTNGGEHSKSNFGSANSRPITNKPESEFANGIRALLPRTSDTTPIDGGYLSNVDICSLPTIQELRKATPVLNAFVQKLTSMSPHSRVAFLKRFAPSDADDMGDDDGGQGACDYDTHSDDAGSCRDDTGVVKTTSSMPIFDTAKNDFQKHATVFAYRYYLAIGFMRMLLLQSTARCDICSGSPGVVDFCRCQSGDLLCYKCDKLRHELFPCSRHRWILVRDAATGEQSPSTTIDACFLMCLLPNDVVIQPSNNAGLESAAAACNIADKSWISKVGKMIGVGSFAAVSCTNQINFSDLFSSNPCSCARRPMYGLQKLPL